MFNPKELKKVPILIGIKQKKAKNTITFQEGVPFVGNGLYEIHNEICSVNKKCPPWEKKISKLFWRGILSDELWKIKIKTDNNKKKNASPRIAIHYLSLIFPNLLDAEILPFQPFKNRDMDMLKKLNIPFSKDSKRRTLLEHANYKYQISLNGIQTSGYLWRLFSDCCVFKVDSEISLWYFKGLKPYVHYIPVKYDLSNLIEQINWALSNDSKAKQIAKNGQDFANKYLKPENFIERVEMILNMYAKYQNKADELIK